VKKISRRKRYRCVEKEMFCPSLGIANLFFRKQHCAAKGLVRLCYQQRVGVAATTFCCIWRVKATGREAQKLQWHWIMLRPSLSCLA